MEKLVYLVWLPEGTTPAAARRTMIDDIGTRLLALRPAGLTIDVDDEHAQVPPPVPATEGEPQVSAIVSIWLTRYDDRGPFEEVLRAAAERIAGYLVTESLYDDYGDTPHSGPRTWPDGQRSPAVLTCSYFPVKRAMAYEDWLDVWHHEVSPVSAEVQPRMRYVRNAVVRAITPDAPAFAGIVEEAWPDADTIVDPMRFYCADGDPEVMQANLSRLLDVIVRFIDLDAMRNNTMSEYILRSFP